MGRKHVSGYRKRHVLGNRQEGRGEETQETVEWGGRKVRRSTHPAAQMAMLSTASVPRSLRRWSHICKGAEYWISSGGCGDIWGLLSSSALALHS